MLKTIVFLVESPFTERDVERFGVDFLLKNFEVLVLDCTQYIKRDFYRKYKNIAAQGAWFHDIGDPNLVGQIIGHYKSNVLTIDLLGSTARANRIRGFFERNKIPSMLLKLGLTPSVETNSIAFPNSLFCCLKNPLDLPSALIRRIKSFFARYTRFEYALCSGLASLDDWRANSAKHKIWAHSFDYDEFLSKASAVANCTKPYAVFLDEDMVYHSDYDHASLIPPATEKEYFGGMNVFFDAFEKKYDMGVVIAVHPRARYDLRPGLWGDRKLISGETAKLVKNASVVLVHQSTSVSYAVLWKKPLVYLTSNELVESFLGGRIKKSSELLGALFINIDMPLSLPEIETINEINENLYSVYKERYIKLPNTAEAPIWNIFTEYMKRTDVLSV